MEQEMSWDYKQKLNDKGKIAYIKVLRHWEDV